MLTGTTSSAGTPEGQVDLSGARASVVADLLVRAGVPPERIETRGAGSAFPPASCPTGTVPDGWIPSSPPGTVR